MRRSFCRGPCPKSATTTTQKKADSAFDDLEIEVDEQEVKAEAENQPRGRKY